MNQEDRYSYFLRIKYTLDSHMFGHLRTDVMAEVKNYQTNINDIKIKLCHSPELLIIQN